MADIIDFRPPDDPTDGWGELVATVFHYEKGHVVRPADPDISGQDFAFRRAMREKMFLALCYDVEALFAETGELDDMPIVIGMINGNGVGKLWTGRSLETLEQLHWAVKYIRDWASGMYGRVAVKAYPANENPTGETAVTKHSKEPKTYTRTSPSVLALQVMPGIEDNWVAFDTTGREVSRASTIEAVQHAAPGADYSPVLDLPGLEGKPLTMGDYVIDDGDGVYYVMPKDQFEDLFVEGGEAPKGRKNSAKHEDETFEYDGRQLSPAELLQELKARDDQRDADNKARVEAEEKQARIKEGQAEPTELTPGYHPEIEPSQEPVYVVEQNVDDLPEGTDAQAWAKEASKAANALGGTSMRVTLSDDGKKILLESWLEKPEDMGHIRWGQPTNPTSASAGDNPEKEHEHDNDLTGGAPDPLHLDEENDQSGDKSAGGASATASKSGSTSADQVDDKSGTTKPTTAPATASDPKDGAGNAVTAAGDMDQTAGAAAVGKAKNTAKPATEKDALDHDGDGKKGGAKKPAAKKDADKA